MSMTATYSPEDNKLRLYSSSRLDKELYQRVKDAGFKWAPKQDLFVAPMWTPDREDLLIELCGEVGDEDTTLVDRAEDRADRFSDYSHNRAKDADRAHAAVHAIADHIPLGQPILVGHHSERHARRDAKRIEDGMRKAVANWRAAEYWKDRAAGAIRHAKYKERPDVRARRIKGLEADKRKTERNKASAGLCVKFWTGQLKKRNPATGESKLAEVTHGNAVWFCNGYDHIYHSFPLAEYPRTAPASQYEGAMSLWSALGGSDGPTHAVCTVDQARDISLGCHNRVIENCERWIAHYDNRLTYERAMLEDSGGTVADNTGPQVGGGCKCWAAPRGGWAWIRKVNKVSVTLEDNWGNGGGNFTRTIPFDKLSAVMTPAEVEEKRAAGLLVETDDKTGFVLLDTPRPVKTAEPEPKPEAAAKFEAMAQTLKAGVQVVAANQLFPTPPELARRMVELAGIQPGDSVLEPSAGTGNILLAIKKVHHGTINLTAVEINPRLAGVLNHVINCADHIRQADFLECNGDLGYFDRIVMNPPFENGADIKHITHALTMLKPGGRLVAICANGPRQNESLRKLAEDSGEWEELPEGTFKQAGTGVNTVLLTINKEPEMNQPQTFSGEALSLFPEEL